MVGFTRYLRSKRSASLRRRDAKEAVVRVLGDDLVCLDRGDDDASAGEGDEEREGEGDGLHFVFFSFFFSGSVYVYVIAR